MYSTDISYEAEHDLGIFALVKPSWKPFQGRIRKRSYRHAILAAKHCLKALKGVVGLVPVIGTHVQSIVSIAITILTKIEELYTWKAGRSALSRRLKAVLDLLTSIVRDPAALAVQNLVEDLSGFEDILRKIKTFLHEHTEALTLKSLFAFPLLCEHLNELEKELDNATENFILKSLVQLRKDVHYLRVYMAETQACLWEVLETVRALKKQAMLDGMADRTKILARNGSRRLLIEDSDNEDFEQDSVEYAFAQTRVTEVTSWRIEFGEEKGSVNDESTQIGLASMGF